jgi:hypothetical protein
MARKRPRPVPVSAPAPAQTAVTAAPPPAPVAPAPVAAPPAAPRAKAVPPERSIVEIIAIRASKILGSLQLAVISLSLFASVVFLGTLMEHWYNTKIAQDLVYRSWWFIGLLFLLSVNIFFAAAKKWPWKKHQTGFVITHIGLLTMLAGGILNAWKGVDAQMAMIDTEDPSIKRLAASKFGTGSNADNSAIFSDTSQIFIREADDPHGRGSQRGGDKGKVIQEDFEGGPLPWNPDEKTASRTDFKLSLLSWLRSPLGRSWSRSIDNTTTLEVIDYLPFAKHVPYGPAERSSGFPALQIEFRSGRVPFAFDGWMVVHPADPTLGEFQPGFDMPGRIEFLGVCPPGLLERFLKPPARDALGKKGVITFAAGEKVVTLDAAEAIRKNHWIDLGGDNQVHVTNYLASWTDDKAEGALDPALEFEWKFEGKVRGTLRVYARRAGFFGIGDRDVPMGEGAPFVAWYEGPDFQFGNDKRKGVLQIVQGPDGKLYYRSFNEREGGFGLETTGTISPGADYTPFWDRMKGRLRVLEYLPNAQRQDKFIAANVTPGKETNDEKLMYSAAIQCRISDGKNKKEFWVPHGRPVTAQVGARTFEVALGVKRKDLGFTIKLERAEQTVDPGTRAPASYTSYVLLYDKEQGINGRREVITMNEPLEHRGYKFYQSQYQDLEIADANGKPVSLSGFTVGYDPGLMLKYLGSVCLACGIFMMFYMRAYFFKPKKKPAAAQANAA